MTEEESQLLIQHARAIAKILYNNAPIEELTSLGKIEEVVRQEMQEHVMPEVGGFFIENVTEENTGHKRFVKSIIGKLPITSSQTQKLELRPHSQLSPYLEACCLRASATVSYQRAAEDVKYATGIEVAKSVQQRLVHRQNFELPAVKSSVEELSVDGGNIRIRTPVGQPCDWKGYKAVRLHNFPALAASFQENNFLIDWVNDQPLAPILTCLGDGHDGIWNIIRELTPKQERREILDWFHLMENLYKVGGSMQRINTVKEFLWKGNVDDAIAAFAECKLKQALNFCAYLEKHRHRIINYQYYQAEQICSIGSGAIESTVKQIDRRTKISGAQWNIDNVPQVLSHRCAYLNGLIFSR
ncbi:ISKra4 family transposase [Mastigocladus laminosus UU774]|nr:ISKra4 family transposase [Mastigocladus laminosus UU774]TFI55619.1 ISKra4 family transposase [Mastigocladus laminosus UU774]